MNTFDIRVGRIAQPGASLEMVDMRTCDEAFRAEMMCNLLRHMHGGPGLLFVGAREVATGRLHTARVYLAGRLVWRDGQVVA